MFLHVLGILGTLGRVGLGGVQRVIVILLEGTVDVFFKDGLGLVDIELGLEVPDVVGDAAAVGAAAGIGKVEALVNDLFAHGAPVALATAILLRLLGVGVGKAVLGKELGHVVVFRAVGLSQGAMGTVIELVRASHWRVSREDER